MTIGRKMDQAWKDAISRGLKASGKINHAFSNGVNKLKNAAMKTPGVLAGGAMTVKTATSRKSIGNALVKNAAKIGATAGVAKAVLKSPVRVGSAVASKLVETKHLPRTTRGHGTVGNFRNATSNSLRKVAKGGSTVKKLKAVGAGSVTATKVAYRTEKLGKKIRK